MPSTGSCGDFNNAGRAQIPPWHTCLRRAVRRARSD
jgi:hypothetical protein